MKFHTKYAMVAAITQSHNVSVMDLILDVSVTELFMYHINTNHIAVSIEARKNNCQLSKSNHIASNKYIIKGIKPTLINARNVAMAVCSGGTYQGFSQPCSFIYLSYSAFVDR